MRRFATMTSKGQITIPVEVRKQLGLGRGDRVEFTLEDGAAVLRPLPPEPNPFGAYAGALGTLADEAAVAAWLRDLRDDDG
ncbi:MAG: AbrB/MazE/SpoVT family DNA-binding domain-containing protein [Trueperaceae bacterium]|nr:AbrB/MazE/SpoVT family DNA-binding domain-containing protein [Trueperaceae bacterium]